MIPTKYRNKLPRHLSYPIGAEAISNALAGLPHFEKLTLTFIDQSVWRASEFQRLLLERLPYKIMEASHQPARKPGISTANSMLQDGSYDDKWELRVYPVLAEFRSVANGLLRDQGLPAVAAWLKSSQQRGWTAIGRGIELRFNPAEVSLFSHEHSGV